MPNYRRLQIPGSTWFFTVNLLQGHNNNLLIEEITTLKACIKKVHRFRPFGIAENWCGDNSVKIEAGE